MKAALHDFYSHIAKKKRYWIPVLFFAIIAYAFSITNRTLGIDDMATEVYWGSGRAMIAATRWGMALWVHLFSTPVFTPFLKKFLAVCLLICGASAMACIAHFLLKRRNVWTYTIFASVLVTYPLIHEIYEYDGANMVVCGNFLLAAIAILYQITHQGRPWKGILVSALPLTVIISSYESGIFVYISAVCLYLFCKYAVRRDDGTNWRWLREGIRFAIPLVLALALRIVIGFALIKLYGLEYAPNGDTSIRWLSGSMRRTLRFLIKDLIVSYGINALVYFPLCIFLIAAALFMIGALVRSARQRRVLPLILGGLVLASLFLQAIIQGSAMPYRTAQTLYLFVAFAAAAGIELGLGTKTRGIRLISLILGLSLCLHQGVYLHRMLALNNQRSDNEIAIVHQLGYRLKSEFEDKPVVFAGIYDMGNWISPQVEVDTSTPGGKLYQKIWEALNSGQTFESGRFIQNTVTSGLNWAANTYLPHQTMLGKCFSYCGYDIQVWDIYVHSDMKEYEQIAREEGMRPFEIRDMGDYILVCLGELPT